MVSAAHPGFLHGFYSLFSVPPAITSGSSSLPLAASLLAPPSSSLGLQLQGGALLRRLFMGWSCLKFLGLPAFSFSLPPVLCFCPVPSPYPLGSAASASAHGFSGVQYPAWLSLSLRLFPHSPYLSLLFVPLPLLHISLNLLGFASAVLFAPRWWLLRLL